jgi:uncharacterized protein YndB with AHSA1/START domain
MNILKWVIVSLLSLALLIIAIAFALPNAYSVSRTVTINAPAEKIYSLIAAPKQWKNWSVWNQRDPVMQMTFSGPDSGTGAGWDWQSKSQGNGGMKFTSAKVHQKLDYELHFEGMGKPSTGSILLEPTTAGTSSATATKVTWSMQGSTEGEFMMKLFAPFIDKMVGADFSEGLNNLKNLAEKP